MRLMSLVRFVGLVRLTLLVGALKPLLLPKASPVPSGWLWERDMIGQYIKTRVQLF